MGAHHERGSILKPVRVGICGLGTVGGGTFNVLTRNADDISRRAGRPIVIEQVAHRSIHPDCDITGINATSDVFEVANNPNVDVLVELIGGYDLARELVLTAIENGKHVVTANKALIAVHGNEIFRAAHKKASLLPLRRLWRAVFRLSNRSAKALVLTVSSGWRAS